MPTFELFSTRQKALTDEPSDILTYDHLPEALRNQIAHIVMDGFGIQRNATFNRYDVEEGYQMIHDILTREYGIFELTSHRTFKERIRYFIQYEPIVMRVLDTVELCIRFIDKYASKSDYRDHTVVKINGESAIQELNERFKQHSIGYQYEGNRLIKVDSTYVHAEIVKPTLQLLFNHKFAGANEEYLKAHEHYRHGRNKECINECLKSFESTMKIICKEKGWAYNTNDTSKTLIKVLIDNDLLPTYLQTQITSLRTLLESGVPTIRNKVGGHGQGATPIIAQNETTRYTLNLTGSNLIYLIELSGL